jgi:uncharacterized protein (DUF1684 family)
MMKYLVYILFFISTTGILKAQDYKETILKYRENYIKDLLSEPRKPVKPEDVRYITFYDPDEHYSVFASFTETPGSTPFMLPTHSGKNKPFRQYGIVDFSINDTTLRLHVYQSIDLLNDMAHKDDLFLPFNDLTNYEFTFGGGRYLDLSIKDIKDGQVLLDFNKCYNPYCAYSEGFSCPIPPEENKLHIEIRAGEKQFQKYLAR